MVPKDLGEYVDWVLAQKPGMDQVDPQVKAEIKAGFVEGLENQINAAIVDAMSEEQVQEFEKVLDGGNPQAISEYCNKAVPQTPDLVAQVLLAFKVNYVGA